MTTLEPSRSPIRRPSRDRRKILVNVLVISISVVLLAGVCAIVYELWVTAEAPRVAVRISPETTYVTAPLRADGSVDYLAAINRRSGQGTTLENNASVLIWQALGPAPYDAGTRDAFFKALGIPTPPEEGNYFISVEQFTEQQAEAEPGDGGSAQEQSGDTEALEDQLRSAVTRPWTQDEFPLLAQWLRANEKPLALVTRATYRPRRYDPLVVAPDVSYQLVLALLPLVSECRSLASALAARAMFRVSAGQTDDAWQDLMAAHRLSRLVAQGPTSVEGLVGRAINGQICAAERALLQHAELTAEQIAQMRGDLDTLSPLSNIVDKLDFYERLTCLDAIFSAANEMSEDAANNFTDDPLFSDLAERRGRSVDWDLVFVRVNSWWDKNIAACRLPTRAMRNVTLADLEEEFDGRVEKAKGIGGAITAFFDSRRVISERVADVFIAVMLPAMSSTCDYQERGALELDLTKLTFSIAAYRADHGADPEKLSDLVPRYIAKVPDDPFAAAPIQYTIDEEGYVLHSNGPNETNDSEAEQDAADETWSDDLIVRMRASSAEAPQP